MKGFKEGGDLLSHPRSVGGSTPEASGALSGLIPCKKEYSLLSYKQKKSLTVIVKDLDEIMHSMTRKAATYSPTIVVPLALSGLTSLFGMVRGEPRCYNHLKSCPLTPKGGIVSSEMIINLSPFGGAGGGLYC